MKKYRIKVNGKLYEVELEAIEEVNENITSNVETKDTNQNNENTIKAPIGGKVIDIKVKVGDKINKGDLICVIEAMKMENEVLSSLSGTIKEIKVSKGAQVANKDVLVIVG